MSSTNTKINILLECYLAINEMKGKEIITLDLQKIDTSVCKYFIICTGNSNTHVNAIESNIKKLLAKKSVINHMELKEQIKVNGY